MSSLLSGCVMSSNPLDNNKITIINGESLTLHVGDTLQLEYKLDKTTDEKIIWCVDNEDVVSISEEGLVTALKEGIAIVKVVAGNLYDMLEIKVEAATMELVLSSNSPSVKINNSINLVTTLIDKINHTEFTIYDVTYSILIGKDKVEINGNTLVGKNIGSATIVSKYNNLVSNTISIEVLPNENNDDDIIVGDDPYVNMSKEEFYSNYEPAKSNDDAYYRSLHGFMSGSIAEQDQAPTLASYQPMESGKYIRNSSYLYSSDNEVYYLYNSHGEITKEIYKNGAYVTLEEVAAYVFAFGDVPPNYTAKKNADPLDSPWGEYLRLNHTYFSGDTTRYPYEPVLPNISGCGGTYDYYEIDIGTTGTDCDPTYSCEVYNDGYNITRGAARIVYSRFDKYEKPLTDINSKYLFYTYNHYNDFQEYLNYEGGWGEMFGNITGGGTISSKNDYNPTDYIETVSKALAKEEKTIIEE